MLAGNLKEAIRNGNLQRDGTACALDVALLALDVAKGCQAIHKYSIIHGDLKPHNVLLTVAPDDERGWIGKIADFGLSVKIKRGRAARERHPARYRGLCGARGACRRGAW